MNAEGIRMVHQHTRPLAVDTMDCATEVLCRELVRGPGETTTPEQWARHLAWVIGFDALIADRKKIHEFTQFIVEPALP